MMRSTRSPVCGRLGVNARGAPRIPPAFRPHSERQPLVAREAGGTGGGEPRRRAAGEPGVRVGGRAPGTVPGLARLTGRTAAQRAAWDPCRPPPPTAGSAARRPASTNPVAMTTASRPIAPSRTMASPSPRTTEKIDHTSKRERRGDDQPQPQRTPAHQAGPDHGQGDEQEPQSGPVERVAPATCGAHRVRQPSGRPSTGRRAVRRPVPARARPSTPPSSRVALPRVSTLQSASPTRARAHPGRRPPGTIGAWTSHESPSSPEPAAASGPPPRAPSPPRGSGCSAPPAGPTGSPGSPTRSAARRSPATSPTATRSRPSRRRSATPATCWSTTRAARSAPIRWPPPTPTTGGRCTRST